uniref:hypothetical protein n=1 Tax=Vibrio anguillarum TaxID=55601 RepID=UPI001BE4DA66
QELRFTTMRCSPLNTALVGRNVDWLCINRSGSYEFVLSYEILIHSNLLAVTSLLIQPQC